MKELNNQNHPSPKYLIVAGLFALFSIIANAQDCPPGPYSVGTSDLIPPCSICLDYSWGTVERNSYISTSSGLNYGNLRDTDTTIYHDQWLDVYIPSNDTSSLTPVYIFAHAGSLYADSPFSSGRDLCEEKIAFISWESAQSSAAVGGSYYENNPDLQMTIKDFWDYTNADFVSVLDWVWENADVYNFDLNNVFVGGGSRGSRMSFNGLDDPERPIRGVFMSQAFADPDWFNVDIVAAQGCPEFTISELVNENYPPLLIHYKNNLGDAMDAHDPANGLEVVERYDCYDIDARIVHSLGNSYSWPPDAIDFIQNIDDYFAINPDKIVDASIIDPESNILQVPNNLQIIWNESEFVESKIQWNSNGWEENILSSPYPNKEPDSIIIQLRLGPVSNLNSTVLNNICEPILWESNYNFNYTSNSNSFSFPKFDFLNTCLIPLPDGSGYFSMDEGQYYGVQIRSNITPESNYYEKRRHNFWTAWTDLLTFEGRCSQAPTLPQPVDLSKSFDAVPFPNGTKDRIQLKWYKDQPKIKFQAEDAAACNIEFWKVKDLATGEIFSQPDTILIPKESVQKPGQELFKWPLKYSAEGVNNTKRVEPNTRYKWRVRCYGDAGNGQPGLWSDIKIFNTPSFNPITGIHDEVRSNEWNTIEKKVDSSSEEIDYLIFPNPSNGVFFLRFDREIQGEMEINIRDLMGRVISTDLLRVKNGELSQRLDINRLPSGTYILSGHIASRSLMRKIVVTQQE